MDDLVTQFLEFTGAFDRGTALEFLKGTNNNFERAVQEYFENPDPSRFAKSVVKWDDSQFSGDREGARSQVEEMPPFQLDDDVRGRSQLQSLTAPSRPPSRTASRASQRTLRGSDVEMSENVPDTDDDLQKAIRMSMLDAQESGTIDSAGHEIVPDVDITERSRQQGDPVFLKPLSNKDFLPSLITILHSIPRCRHLLLAKKDLLLNYGQNLHWWSGESIEVSRIMDLDHNYGRESMDILDAVHETQRLMAFLDKSNRAYGSAAALSRLPAMNESYSMDGDCLRFLKMCEKAAKVIQSNPNQPSLFISSTSAASSVPLESVYMLKLAQNDLPYEAGGTLYDVLDKFLGIEDSPGIWLETIAPVLVIRLPAKPVHYNSGVDRTQVIIPSTLYADRYHVANRETMLEMYTGLTGKREMLHDIVLKLAKIESFKSFSLDKPGSTAALLNTTMSYFRGRKQKDVITEASATEAAIDTNQILEKLQTIYDRLNERIADLRQEQARAEAELHELSQLLTKPTNEESAVQPVMRYRLLGVATVAAHHAETYIRSSIPSVHARSDSNEWWRFTYDTGGRGTAALMMKEALDEATVLSAAGKLEETTLLVFANDAMLDTTGLDTELPDALKDFVNTDNAAFQAELADYEARAAQPPIPLEPPPEYEPPPYPPPGERTMQYDGQVDLKETVSPADLESNGQNVVVHVAEEIEDKEETENKAKAREKEEEDVEMTDISS